MSTNWSMIAKLAWQCDCADPGCPVHIGTSQCSDPGTARVYRVDMDDRDGTQMCEDCAADARESGMMVSMVVR